jgi:D-aminopeptidase
MKIDQIEDILGQEAVELVENACTVAFKAAESCGDTSLGAEAVRELLLQMLAAAIITPNSEALERSKEAAAKLTFYVKTALAPSKGASPRQN